MRWEAVKGYKVPTEASRDLIGAYFETKRRALREVLGHVALVLLLGYFAYPIVAAIVAVILITRAPRADDARLDPLR